MDKFTGDSKNERPRTLVLMFISLLVGCALSIGVLAAVHWIFPRTVSMVGETSQAVSSNWTEISTIEIPVLGGSLAATLCLPTSSWTGTSAIIIAGSGPTDRNGNDALGLFANSYQYLARDLAAQGVVTVRYDKRGIGTGSSRDLLTAANAASLKFTNYTDDAAKVALWLKADQKVSCVWLIGHSEGALIAEVVGSDPSMQQSTCGVVSISGAGYNASVILTIQLQSDLPPSACKTQLLAAIQQWAQGQRVPFSAVSSCNPNDMLVNSLMQQQGYVISWFSFSPTFYMAQLQGQGKPVLIVQGTRDLQVTPADALSLQQAYASSSLLLLGDMNHVLKIVSSSSVDANKAAYYSPTVPIPKMLSSTLASFFLFAKLL